jgi:outer membrane receptor protein involved in Fe transport
MQVTHVSVFLRRLGIVATGTLLLSPGVAQSTNPTGAADSPDNETTDSETVILSPFVVDAAEDEGYRATSTLAGSRIKTNLRDVASPITVVTKEFLNDISAADLNDVLAYVANAEGTRDFTASNNSLGRPTDDIAANPFGANRIRGLGRAETTRDYFHTINNWIGFDTYNLDAVTINRGPNSILAGLGNPAGIVNYSPQLASTSRNQTTVSFRYGSYGDARAVLNTNYVAQEDKLAFRVAGLWADRGFKQKPSHNRDKRLYLTGTWKPFAQTTLRAGYEFAQIKANNPNSLTPEDGITQWLARGSPVYDSSLTGATIPAPLSQGPNEPVVVYDADGNLEGWWNANTRATYFQTNLNGVSLWSGLRMNSNEYLNVDSRNLNPSLDEREFKAFNVSLEQEILPGLYANVAYVNEDIDNERLNLFRTEYAVYMIDPNVRLPNGDPNPHFGETYMEFRGLDNLGADRNSNEIVRGTVTYDLDLRDTNKWLGRYRLTGFLESRDTETQGLQWNSKVTSDPAYETFRYRYYLGGSATADPTAVPGQPGLVSGVPGIPPGFPTTTSGASQINSFYGLKSDRKRLEKLSTGAVVVQAYLWDDKIVGMYGFRNDTNKGAEAIGASIGNNMVNPAGDYPDGALEASKFTQDTTTYGVVVHPLSWLSLHYNKSENFVPNAGKVDLLLNPTPPPSGEGEDYGFSLNLLEDKLHVKVNWFKLTAAGASAESVTFPLNQWTVPFLELTIMPDIASTPAFQAAHPGFVYQKAMGDGLVTGDTRLNGGYTSDQVSEGIELEFTYNVTKNWRVMGSVAKQEAKQSNIAGSLTEFIEERLDYWESSGLFDYLVSPGGGWGQNLTGREYWERDSLGAYIGYRSGEGRPSTQLAKWHASALTNYSFTEGRFKGFSIGGGARYIEGAVIGNPVFLDADGRVTGLDLDNPYKNSGYVALDAWLGYRTKIYDDKYDLSFQLNIRDLQEGGHFRPIAANSDGTHAAYRIVQPRTFYLTTTLEF